MANNITTQVTITAKDLASAVFNKIGNEVKTVGGNIKSYVADNMQAGGMAAAGLGAAFVGLGATAISSAAKFESMGVSLVTAFQGNEAAAAAAQASITKFAAQTPFQLEEVLTGFLKLKNMGLDPSEKALTSYGDTASAMGKSLNDMVEAVADAATGEFERLKEFGIRSSSEGDKVTFTFQGVKTTVGKNAKEIEDYLIKLGQTKFAGGMAAQSKTFNGMISTMKDTFALAMADIAQKSGIFKVAKDALSQFLVQMETAVPVIVNFIKAIAENKTALMGIAGAFGGLLVLAVAAFVTAFSGALVVMTGFAAAGAVIVMAGSKISGAFSGVMPALKAFIDAVGNKMKPVIEAVKNALIPAFQQLFTAVKPILTVLGALFGTLGVAILGVIVGIVNAFATALPFIINIISGFITVVAGMINLIVAMVTGQWGQLPGIVSQIFMGMAQLIFGVVGTIIGAIYGFVKGVYDFFKWLYDVLVGHSIIPDMVNAILSWFTKLWNTGVAIFQAVYSAIVSIVTALRDYVVFKAIELVNGVITFFMQLPGQVANIFNNLSNQVKNIFQSIVSFVVNKANELYNSAASIFNNLKNNLVNTFNSLKDSLSSIVNSIWNSLTSIFNSISSSITNIVNGLLNSVTSIFNSIKNNLVSAIENAKSSMMNSVNSWQSSFQSAINGIPAMVGSVFSQISGQIGGALQNAYNTAMAWWNSLTEIWNNIIAGAQEAASYASGGGGSTSGNATGGMVPGAIGAPKWALVHGGEEIVPYGKTRGSSTGGGGGVTLNVNVGLYAGSETEKRNIAESLYKSLMMVAKSQNKTVIELLGA